MAEKTIQKFLGQVSDRGGEITKKVNQFDRLINCYSDLHRLRVRGGTIKQNGVTNAPAGITYGMYEYTMFATNVGLGFQYMKAVGSTLWVYGNQSTYGFAWRAHGQGGVPTVLGSGPTLFADMNGENAFDTSINVSGTLGAASTRTNIVLGSGSHAINALVGAIITIDYGSGKKERKVILGNTATTVSISEDDPLNSAPASGTSYTIKPSGHNVYLASNGVYAKVNPKKVADTTLEETITDGYTRLDNEGAYSYPAQGIVAFGGRMYTWNNDTLRWSDLNNADNFSMNATMKFPGGIFMVKPFSDNVLIVYERRKITAIIGTDPLTQDYQIISENEGLLTSQVVSNYTSIGRTMQIYVNNNHQVKAITPEIIRDQTRETKALTLSQNYVQDKMRGGTFSINCAAVSPDGMYHIARSDGTALVLDLKASELLNFEEWLWHEEVRPPTNTPNVFGYLNGYLVGGSYSNGQLYQFYLDSVYTDDGSPIDVTIERRGLQFEQFGDLVKWYSMNIAQGPSGGASTVNVYTKAGNTPTGNIDNLLGTYIANAGSKFRRFRIKNNPSLGEGSGTHIDYKITISSSVQVAPIESIQFTYFPGIIR
jgi:hypothetical protein